MGILNFIKTFMLFQISWNAVRAIFVHIREVCQIEAIETSSFWKTASYLEAAFKGHLLQTPCNEKDHRQLDQAAQSS